MLYWELKMAVKAAFSPSHLWGMVWVIFTNTIQPGNFNALQNTSLWENLIRIPHMLDFLKHNFISIKKRDQPICWWLAYFEVCALILMSFYSCRFILDHLLGSIEANSEEKETGVRVNRSAASTILEDGIVEVDGIPRDGKQRRNASEYDSYELEKGVTDLSRGLRYAISPPQTQHTN